MVDTRLIERWFPIAELSAESVRERAAWNALPAIYYLHIWWARRPLVASRAAILASLLPSEADQEIFKHTVGIHGDPAKTKKQIDAAKRKRENLGSDPYGYKRAFTYSPSQKEKDWISTETGKDLQAIKILDPTAGGGSIPFEANRLGLSLFANDLNPVAAFIIKATAEWPTKFGTELIEKFDQLSEKFIQQSKIKYKGIFPNEPTNSEVYGYIWARTISCPYCDGLIPLAPNWRLAKDGVGVRLKPVLQNGLRSQGRICNFEIVLSSEEQSVGTIVRGSGVCPFTDCGRVIDGDEIKNQAESKKMGDQLVAISYKGLVHKKSKSGKRKTGKLFRAPRLEDDNSEFINNLLNEKLPKWTALDYLPNEKIPHGNKTSLSHRYGMSSWRDFFSPRQLLCHGLSVEIFREMLDADRAEDDFDEIHQVAYAYLAIAIDRTLSFNTRAGRWASSGAGRVLSIFDRHDFGFVWSYAEMAPQSSGNGYKWAIQTTRKCIKEFISLSSSSDQPSNVSGELFPRSKSTFDSLPYVTVSCKSGDSLDHILDKSIDVVVMDPPYYDNVMYAELSDFFYVWLKRTAGQVIPELFRQQLTDKDREAVANPAKFRGQEGTAARASRDYQDRMALIFAECHRVLKPNGILTLMFTHKATEAWDALTTGLLNAGFCITASWPVNTESESSLHIRGKAAANSTIFLVCRPRADNLQSKANRYWEDIEHLVAEAVGSRIEEFQNAGIRGVDLYLASFGPALECFSSHWPLERGRPRQISEERKRRRQKAGYEDEWDPYAVTPEDALDAARKEVKRRRLEQLAHLKTNADLDPTTAFLVLAWDAFKAPTFSYDEALRLAHAVGVDLDNKIIGRLAGKRGSNIHLWDSARRAAESSLGPIDGSRGMVDAIHHAANIARSRSPAAARELLETSKVDQDPNFFTALEAMLEVLPISKTFTDIDLEGDAAASGRDFEALYNLFRLAYSDKMDEPEQLNLSLSDAQHKMRQSDGA